MSMRTFLFLVAMVLFALVAAVWWKYSSIFPKRSQETVQLDAKKQQALINLKDEKMFEPHNYPPLGYTGVATPDDGAIARATVNDVIGSILLRGDGPIAAPTVSGLIRRGMKRVNQLETEDRDRTADYMIEVWYLLEFKGSTGEFAYGSAFRARKGYGERLPPEWKSPTEPRMIGRQ